MKKLWFMGLVLALAVTLKLPSAAMAASPDLFSASGILTGIDEGTVIPLDNNQWQVTDRHIQGEIIKSVQGKSNKINGDFTITYGGIFNIETQAGDFTGKMESSSAILDITGSTQPCSFAGLTQVPDGNGGLITVPLYQLSISGSWTGTRGLKAQGVFEAYLVFIPTPEGHVAAITDSYFNMYGDYLKKK